KKDLILNIECEPIAAAVVTERISCCNLHRLRVDHRDPTWPVLEDLVDCAFAIADRLLRYATEIDVSQHCSILRINYQQGFRRMAADVDPIVEGVAINAVRAEFLWNFDRLDEFHGL